ncbi:hypothetical protein GGI43DRAFT_358416 [Trichoderma evansii]
MHQWISQSNKEDPWTPLSHVASSARLPSANPATKDSRRDISKNCATQSSAQGKANTQGGEY